VFDPPAEIAAHMVHLSYSTSQASTSWGYLTLTPQVLLSTPRTALIRESLPKREFVEGNEILYINKDISLETCTSGASACVGWGPSGAGVSGGGWSKLCSYVRHGVVEAPMEACPRPDRPEKETGLP
jgi:hypothetical protein